MKRRDRTDIIGQILQAANGNSITKTKIMYIAYLGHDQLEEYLKILHEKGLLWYDSNTQTFKTTEKGLRFLEVYEQMRNAIKAEQKRSLLHN
jgi:predicted transcriptional regulator